MQISVCYIERESHNAFSDKGFFCCTVDGNVRHEELRDFHDRRHMLSQNNVAPEDNRDSLKAPSLPDLGKLESVSVEKMTPRDSYIDGRPEVKVNVENMIKPAAQPLNEGLQPPELNKAEVVNVYNGERDSFVAGKPVSYSKLVVLLSLTCCTCMWLWLPP